MDGKSTYLANKVLDQLGGVSITPPANFYAALFDRAGAELTGNGYARKAIAANQSNWPAASSRLIANGVEIAFSAATGAWSATYRMKLYDASSGGNIWYQSFFGDDFGKGFTAKVDDTITVPGHALAVNDEAVILAVDGSTLPVGLTDELIVWVKTVSGDDITVSLTQGGAAVNITTVGAGIIKKLQPKSGITAPDVARWSVGECQFKES